MSEGFIDIYCERTGPEFWSEPVNAVTNAAFLLAAALLMRRLARGEDVRTDVAGWSLAVLVLVIGIGSALFHTYAQRWAMLADVIPIAVFILAYTWCSLRRFGRLPAWAAGAGVAAVLGVALAVPALTGFRGGSYVAALTALVVIGGWLFAFRRHPAGRSLLAAAAVFAVSLTFRTMDGPVCDGFPLGTHFMWHLLNALVLYIVTRAMIAAGPRGDTPLRSA